MDGFASRDRIGANGPFDHLGALHTLSTHAVDGLQQCSLPEASLTRWINVDGDAFLVRVTLDAAGVTIRTSTADAGVNTAISSRVSQWFDLETNLSPINDHLGAHPIFTRQVREQPGLRITRFQAAFEAVVLTVLGQQVTLAAARLFGARLVAAYGSPAPGVVPPAGGLLCRFPAPEVLAARPLTELQETLGITGVRTRTVREVAELFAALGPVDELPPRVQLGGVYGIGPWTLDYLAIRAGADPDAFPASDAVLRRVLRAGGLSDPDAASSDWRPFRSYAASRLWALAGRPTGTASP